MQQAKDSIDSWKAHGNKKASGKSTDELPGRGAKPVWIAFTTTSDGSMSDPCHCGLTLKRTLTEGMSGATPR